jgi:hypothetical protein
MRTRSVKGVRIASCISSTGDNMAEPSESNSLELRSPFTMRYHDIKIGRLTPPSPR